MIQTASKKISDSTIELIELHPKEIELIKTIRNSPFGEITIMMRNGLPNRIRRIIEFTNLD